MRILKPVLLLSLPLLLAYSYFAFLYPVQPIEEHPFFGGTGPLVIAHQGGRGLRPENTLAAFEHSRRLGVDVLEMDLRGTRDGDLVVIHDRSVDRTTDGMGLVPELGLEELRRLDAGYHFEDDEGSFPYRGTGIQIPTLREVLSSFPEIRLNLEMKDFDAVLARSLCRELRRFGAEGRTLVASFGHEPMAAFRDSCPGVATSSTMREGLIFYQLDRLWLSRLFRSPALAFQLPEYFGDKHVVKPALLEISRSRNVRVQVWTVNEEEDLARMLELGVDGILTDYPDRLLRLLGRLPGGP